jgi:hypothetical protein
MQPPRIITSPGEEYGKSNRGAQGVAGIERAPGGRLWAAWYTGTSRAGVESSKSYCVLATSADDGHTWTDVVLAIQTPWPVHKEGVGGVMMATFREADVRAGKPVTDKARLQVVISQLR